MAGWYVVRDGREEGPIPPTRLRDLAAAGRLSRGDLVRREDMPAPVAASRLAGLFAAPVKAAHDEPPGPAAPRRSRIRRPGTLAYVYASVLVPTALVAAAVVAWRAHGSAPAAAAGTADRVAATSPISPPRLSAGAGEPNRPGPKPEPATLPPADYPSARGILRQALLEAERGAAGGLTADAAANLVLLAGDFAEVGDVEGVGLVRDLIERAAPAAAPKHASDLGQAALVAAVVGGDRSAAGDYLRRGLEDPAVGRDDATAAAIGAAVAAARLTAAGDFLAADALISELERAARRLSNPAARTSALVQAAVVRQTSGQTDDAVRLLEEVRQAHTEASFPPPHDEIDFLPALLGAAASLDGGELDRVVALGPRTATWPRAVDLARKLMCEGQIRALDLKGARETADRIGSPLLGAEATFGYVRRLVEVNPDAGWRKGAMQYAAAAIAAGGSGEAVRESGRARPQVERELAVKSAELLAAGGEDKLLAAMEAEFGFGALPAATRLRIAAAALGAAYRRGDDASISLYRRRTFAAADEAPPGDGEIYLLGMAVSEAAGAEEARAFHLANALSEAEYLRGVAAAEREREWLRHAAGHGLVLTAPGEKPQLVMRRAEEHDSVRRVTATCGRAPQSTEARVLFGSLRLMQSDAHAEDAATSANFRDRDRMTFFVVGVSEGLVVAFPGTYAGLRGAVSCATSEAFGEQEQQAMVRAAFAPVGDRHEGGLVRVRKLQVWGRPGWAALDVRWVRPRAAGPGKPREAEPPTMTAAPPS